MKSFLGRLFSPSTERRFLPDIEKIHSYRDEISSLSDEQLQDRAKKLRERVLGGEDLSSLVHEGFALVQEAAGRTLQQRHYDVQFMGGLTLFQGKIAEMATGEGKTLAATAPVFVHGLSGKGVHVITVNDYLARRDAVWMGQIYHFLGLSVSCLVHEGAFMYDPSWVGEKEEEEDKERDETGSFRVQHDFLRPVGRAEAYRADIVYGTNHEFGFDYLRDNLATSSSHQVQRGHYVAFIDEVDSILIDEARTPLIISAPDVEAAQYYKSFAQIVPTLSRDDDYVVDEKLRSADILEPGIEKIEKALGIENLYDVQNVRLAHYLEESLKAYALFRRDRHYVVKNGEIIIVDEFTGRLMPGRRFSGGLHQALEAKEGVPVQQESRTFANITIQNYFRLYEMVAGMTGTAETSAEEFQKVYGLEVIQIPTHKPLVRKDLDDKIYKTKEAKYNALVEQVKEAVERKQPVLVGTTSIDENELLAGKFSQAGIAHEVLNAKNHEREGEIIAQAGRPGQVTLATNLAGRGVDIVLGGNPPQEDEAKLVKEAGGLMVIGTQRNDARRIDNQLRGRSGRQGDPGVTQFLLSLEDDLLRVFGGEKVQNLMTTLKVPEDEAIESPFVLRIIKEAQKKVEGFHFDARKHVFEYDTVLDKQRTAFYRRRQSILEKIEKGEVKELMTAMLEGVLSRLVQQSLTSEEEEDTKKRLLGMGLFSREEDINEEVLEKIREGEVPSSLKKRLEDIISQEQTGNRILGALDLFWMHHLENLEALLESVKVRAYGQKDPLVEYKRESYILFQTLFDDAETMVVSRLFAESYMKENVLASIRPVQKQPTQASHQKVGRNDPCWCGSGKKFKKCHGK